MGTSWPNSQAPYAVQRQRGMSGIMKRKEKRIFSKVIFVLIVLATIEITVLSYQRDYYDLQIMFRFDSSYQ